MATTTNYSWSTPDDTALVKDGAAAIRTLGSSVDTTTKALNPSTTLGDIEYRSSTANTNTRLGIGTTGQVLTVAGGVPTWAIAGGGGMTLLSTTTLSGASTTISVSPTGYIDLAVYVTGVTLNTNDHFKLQYNTITTSNYQSLMANADDGVAATNTAQVDTHIWLSLFGVAGIGVGPDNQFVVNFKNCNSSTRKIVQSNGAFNVGSDRYVYNQISALSTDTAVITELKFSCPTATMTGGTVLVYGVK
jgi:hypothetical protein